MKRREFIGLLGGSAAAWPLVARAQQSSRTRRIGVLFALPESDRQAQSRLAVFRGQLQKLGWADIQIDTRYVASNDAETHQRYAKELIALQPDLLIAQNSDSLDALLQQTHIIPIIFTIVADPVGRGYVTSFPRPGGNVTGFVTGETSMGGKWLEMLKEIAPNVTRVLVPYNAPPASAEYWLNSLRATAALLGIDVSAAFIHDMSEFEAAVAAHANAPNGGLVVMPDAYLTGHRVQVTLLAASYRLPTVYAYRFYAENGGLLAYGTDLLDNFRRAAIYADRILRGERVSELPVQAPEKFELVLNLKTAKALDIVMPATLIGRADEVIE